MTIDSLHFTPWTSLAGGMLIGLAAALLDRFEIVDMDGNRIDRLLVTQVPAVQEPLENDEMQRDSMS
jgi:hypothetical protein